MEEMVNALIIRLHAMRDLNAILFRIYFVLGLFKLAAILIAANCLILKL